jgi:hypothetical protein
MSEPDTGTRLNFVDHISRKAAPAMPAPRSWNRVAVLVDNVSAGLLAVPTQPLVLLAAVTKLEEACVNHWMPGGTVPQVLNK